MEDKLLKIINHYGINPQLKKLNEEHWELQDAVKEHELNMSLGNGLPIKTLIDSELHILEELSDVMVMLEQFRLYYGIAKENITKIMERKIDRQLDRIEKEN